MTSTLFIVSEDGHWEEECTEPLTTLTGASADITVVAPTGGIPVVDERSADPEEVDKELAEHVVEVHENDERLQSPEPTARVDADEYNAMVFLGDHGTARDVNQDRHARQALLRAVADGNSKTLIVCHAVGILGFTRRADGSFLIEGYEVTGSPDEWGEGIVDDGDLMPDGRELPYWVEDEMKAVGGVWDAELDSDISATMDSDPTTARGSGSLATAAQTLLDEL